MSSVEASSPLAPPAAQTLQQRDQALKAFEAITAASHELLNCVIPDPPDKPSWFDAFSAALDDAKGEARKWIDDLAPAATAGVGTTLVNLGTTSVALASQVETILKSSGDDKPDSPTLEQVTSILDAYRQDVVACAKPDGIRKLLQWSQDMSKTNLLAAIPADFGADALKELGQTIDWIQKVQQFEFPTNVLAALSTTTSLALTWQTLAAGIESVSQRIATGQMTAKEILDLLQIEAANQEWQRIISHATPGMGT